MDYAIEMLNITKDFPGIRANDDVTLRVKKGSIHALLGENGAGKSTLMSILFGLYKAEHGQIKINGQVEEITNPNVATKLKIGMVHQHFKLVHNFTITENIILGLEPVKQFGQIDLDSARKKIIEKSESYGFNVDPDALIENISVGMQQRVEILKMLYRDADILIFDEPTAVLTPQEIHELMLIMKNLANEGKTIILITHKLKEIKQVADECTILRRGKVIGSVDVKKTTEEEMAQMMVGRTVNFNVNKPDVEIKDIVLDVKDLQMTNASNNRSIKNVSFSVKSGEVLGIAGIEGNGQSDLIYALTGLSQISNGQITLNGKDITSASIDQRFKLGMGHIPEDRHKHGLILDFKLKDNLVIHQFQSEPFSKNGILNYSNINKNADRLISEFDIRAGQGSETITRSMSGGNQQKAIIAREIDLSPDCLIVVQPTRGLDVGAIEYIHDRIMKEKAKGKAILLVSLELDEIIDLSDRISVMYNGEIVGTVNACDTNENELGLMMSGSKRLES